MPSGRRRAVRVPRSGRRTWILAAVPTRLIRPRCLYLARDGCCTGGGKRYSTDMAHRGAVTHVTGGECGHWLPAISPATSRDECAATSCRVLRAGMTAVDAVAGRACACARTRHVLGSRAARCNGDHSHSSRRACESPCCTAGQHACSRAVSSRRVSASIRRQLAGQPQGDAAPRATSRRQGTRVRARVSCDTARVERAPFARRGNTTAVVLPAGHGWQLHLRLPLVGHSLESRWTLALEPRCGARVRACVRVLV